MASADPINHDAVSTAATVGGSAVKYGLLGILAAAALGFAGMTIIVGALAAVAGAIPIAATAGMTFGMGVSAMLSGGAATWVVGGVGAALGAFAGGGYGLLGGAALGIFKGADRVSRESSAFRAKVTERMNGRENQAAKNFDDGEVKGLDEGYALAVADLKPQLQAEREAGRKEGAEMVVQQLQEHMQAEMAAQQQTAEGPNHAKHRVDAPHDKPHGPKQPVKVGNAVIASCECLDENGKGSKAAAIVEQQKTTGVEPHALG